MKNRSLEYLSLRPITYESAQRREKDEVEEFFTKITGRLTKLKELVDGVEKECVLYCIPSFKSKIEIVKRIEAYRYKIAVALTKAKGVMEQFSEKYQKSINAGLVESMGVHFHFKLDGLITRMNEALQKIEEKREGLAGTESDPLFSESSSSVEGVYKSVYFISTLIRELKTVVLSQSEKIERLDIAMDRVTYSAEKSSKEIASLSAFGSHIKNRIITVLFCSIFVLIVLSAIKASRG
ncbi:hypothetical protein NEHOM01_0771 [Nematocida homosporus]|uniref:uncharacterized protein n=1 Tax=Nematocida homosporus TaxID=1912981 RepID=UPI002220F378|nr:uncharacterized protein NEHOM01_0771 [Nematocida homosporus]KAI5185356.1 hypothetical protein NEHOM01_0771 [Nematocida homosporus]